MAHPFLKGSKAFIA